MTSKSWTLCWKNTRFNMANLFEFCFVSRYALESWGVSSCFVAFPVTLLS